MESQNTLFSNLFADWLRGRAGDLSPATYVKYEQLIRRHILPFFHELPSREFLKQDFSVIDRRIHHQLMTSGLSADNQRTSIMIINHVLDYGYRRRIIAEPIHFSPHIRRKKNIVRIFSQEDLYRLEAYINQHPHPYTLAIFIALYSGVRIGELCAIRWRDIDFENATLLICRTVQRLKQSHASSAAKTELYVSPPKSSAGTRLIPLPSFVMEFLRSFAPQEPSDNYLFTNRDVPLEPRTLQYAYRRILQACQVPYLNFHCIRHTFATRCVTLGWDVKTLSEILGHAEIQVTMEYYVHSSLEHKRMQMNKLQQVGSRPFSAREWTDG